MAFFADRIKSYFYQHPLPRSAFQLTSHYLSGIHVSHKEGKIKNHFILPFESEIIQPSFSRKNIKNPALLEQKIKEGLGKLRLSDHKIACLIPELSLKAFVLSFNSLPPSRQEREQIIRFRVKKQMPSLPDDARFSFEIISSNNIVKILALVARASVIKEYENFFGLFRLKIRAVGVSTLSLHYLMNREEEENLLLINIEEDFLSLMAIVNSEIALYRLKPYIPDSQTEVSGFQRIEDIVKEVEKTINFIEDKERIKIHSFWVRLGLLETEQEISSHLKEKLPFSLRGIEECLTLELGLKEKKILSPLIGQIL